MEDSDSDYEFDLDSEQPSQEELDRNTRNLNDLEKKINQWKLEKLYEQTQSNQDLGVLKQYKQEISVLFDFLKRCVETGYEKCPVPEHPEMKEIVEFMKSLGDLDVSTRVQILHILKRDLLEFPFTYSSQHLKTLSQE